MDLIHGEKIKLQIMDILLKLVLLPRYILYDVNPGEGFNLRRDVFMRMAVLVKKLNELYPQKFILVTFKYYITLGLDVNRLIIRFFHLGAASGTGKLKSSAIKSRSRGAHFLTSKASTGLRRSSSSNSFCVSLFLGF